MSNNNRIKGLPLAWTSGLSEDEKKEFEKAVRNDTYVLSKLRKVIDEEIENLDRQEISSSSYDNPSWAFKQAHGNGVRAGLIKVRRLLEFF